MKNCKFFRFLFGMLFLLMASLSLGAQNLKVVATTEWTAAFCRAAGIESVYTLAPSALRHPPDYGLRPADIPVLAEADFIVFAGYEGMMERIRSTAPKAQLIKITTTYAPKDIVASVTLLAERAGTQGAAQQGLKEIQEAWDEGREMVLQAGLAGKNVAAHVFQAPFLKQMGMTIVHRFGPMPPTPANIAKAAKSGAELVVDNWHNPVSSPIREVLPETLYAELFNFPGRLDTVDLKDVICANAKLFIQAQ
ncbi:MAG: ABC transporter substrate-binding protein [Spirochaetales bacterium]|nr:ABC transporter substrate-binding protein [Spirochaetales bacterium]